MMTLKFLHASGLFLDSPFKGLTHLSPDSAQKLKAASLRVLDELVNLAISEHVDFVLIAGDITESQTYGLRGVSHFVDATRKLDEAGIRTIFFLGENDLEVTGNFFFGPLPKLATKLSPGVSDSLEFEVGGASVRVTLEGIELPLQYPVALTRAARSLGFGGARAGVELVEVESSKTQSKTLDVDVVDFREIHVDVSELEKVSEIVELARAKAKRVPGKDLLLRLVLDGRSELAIELGYETIVELLTKLNQTSGPDVHWVDYQNQAKPPLNPKESADALTKALERCAELYLDHSDSSLRDITRAKARLIHMLQEAK